MTAPSLITVLRGALSALAPLTDGDHFDRLTNRERVDMPDDYFAKPVDVTPGDLVRAQSAKQYLEWALSGVPVTPELVAMERMREAAPEMLEALEYAGEIVRDVGEPEDLAIVFRAIAKAKGEM